MTANDIITAIVEMHKDYTVLEIHELIEGKAIIADLPFIRDELVIHQSQNETNAASIVVELINDLLEV